MISQLMSLSGYLVDLHFTGVSTLLFAKERKNVHVNKKKIENKKKKTESEEEDGRIVCFFISLSKKEKETKLTQTVKYSL
jgi:hypothetical protein